MFGLSFPVLAPPKVLAAVDLGSNSFHLIVARLEDGQLHVIDRLREMVRLAAGLNKHNDLQPEAAQRALDCLARFGERLRDLPKGSVRIVGTNTLRKARNSAPFLIEAEQALGHPIEIIAGREEARLVYLGVAHSFAGDKERRLVVDIGGGSTECIVGEGFDTVVRESLFMGCVSMSQRWFADGVVTADAMRRAVLQAHREVAPLRRRYSDADWKTAIGSSGTAKALAAIIEAQQWSDGGISRRGLDLMRDALVHAGHVDKLELDGIKAERRPVLAGGLAVMSGVFDGFDIHQMDVSDMALREGLLYDLIGRFQHADVRDSTVTRLAKRMAVDQEQAAQVEATADRLLACVAEDWGLNDEGNLNLLNWACRLHEIGLVISRGQHHKHAAYILGNADMAGFSRQEQHLLAALVRGHRRRFPKALFDALPDIERLSAIRLCVLLRLSALLHRGRNDQQVSELQVVVSGSKRQKLRLFFPAGWLASHPLTAADLSDEILALKVAGIKLKVKEKPE